VIEPLELVVCSCRCQTWPWRWWHITVM